eukprot:5626735-Amphidinium_carterae.1
MSHANGHMNKLTPTGVNQKCNLSCFGVEHTVEGNALFDEDVQSRCSPHSPAKIFSGTLPRCEVGSCTCLTFCKNE